MKRRRRFDTQAGHAYDVLRRRILNREFAPGTRLVLRDLAEQLGTSVIPVRDALVQLTTERLTVGGAGQGWEVVSLSTLDVREVCVVREALETESVRRCAETAGPEDVAYLRSVAEALDGMYRETAQDPLELEWRFHTGIAEIAKCELLREEIERTLVVCFLATATPARNLTHGLIVDAIASGDPGEAEAVMRDHVVTLQKWVESGEPGNGGAAPGEAADR